MYLARNFTAIKSKKQTMKHLDITPLKMSLCRKSDRWWCDVKRGLCGFD